jgi:hypothetical protein
MRWFSVRISGGFFLATQAIVLQLLWMPGQEISTAGPTLIAFDILSLLALLAIIGFFMLNYIGWLLALMVQGACLFAALVVHFQASSFETRLTMFYSVLMVLYLNSFFVRTAFGPDLNGQHPAGADE